MSFELKKTILFKEDPQKQGMLFSIENNNERFLKIRGVAKEFINHMLAGKSHAESREIILNEYNVTADVLDADLVNLKSKLVEIDFIEA